MSDAPTPETDLECEEGESSSWVDANFARRLERERDELRARLEEAEADYKELARHHNMECTCLEIY